MKKNRKFKEIFPIIVASICVGYSLLFLLSIVSSMSKFTKEITGLVLGGIGIPCILVVGLILRMMKANNLKKWEVVIYNVISILIMFIVVMVSRKILDVLPNALRAHNPYDPKTVEFDEYNEECGFSKILFPSLIYFLAGYSCIISVVICSIISIVITFKKEFQSKTEDVKRDIKQNRNAKTSIVENIAKTSMEEENEIKFCSNCGKEIDTEGNFCKYCGKEIK